MKPDVVYHLAGQSHVKISFDLPEYTADSTGLGTLRLLESVRSVAPDARLFLAATSEIFGEPSESPQTEKTPMNPINPYAAAKVYALNLVRIYRKAYGVFACAGILFNHESPRRGENYVTRKIARAAARIARGKQKELHLGTLEPRRDWSYAPDIVDGMRRIVAAPKADDFVLASGVSHSVGDFCKAAFSVVGLDFEKYVVLDAEYVRPIDISETRGDASKARRELGWAPRTALRSARAAHGRGRARRRGRRQGIRLRPPAVLVPAFRRVEASRRAIRSLLTAGARANPLTWTTRARRAATKSRASFRPSRSSGRRPPSGGPVRSTSGSRRPATAESAVLFFNQDVTCASDYFARLGEAVDANPGALVGSAVMYAQEPARVWSAGGAVEWWGRGIRVLHHGAPAASLPAEPFPADWLFGMGTYVPVEVFDRIGLPDAERFPMAWSDLDFSLRAKRAGIPVVVAPKARALPRGGRLRRARRRRAEREAVREMARGPEAQPLALRARGDLEAPRAEAPLAALAGDASGVPR